MEESITVYYASCTVCYNHPRLDFEYSFFSLCVSLFFSVSIFFLLFEGVLSVLRGGERVYFFPVRLMGQVFPLAGLLNLIYYYLITSSCLISLSLLPSLPPMISACMFFSVCLSVSVCFKVKLLACQYVCLWLSNYQHTHQPIALSLKIGIKSIYIYPCGKQRHTETRSKRRYP